MRFSEEKLVKLLSEAFCFGQNCPYDLKDQVVEEILLSNQTTQKDSWVILPFSELRCLPSGRKIFHSMFGDGVITIKNGERFVQFSNFRIEIAEDGWPWDQKLQVIS